MAEKLKHILEAQRFDLSFLKTELFPQTKEMEVMMKPANRANRATPP